MCIIYTVYICIYIMYICNVYIHIDIYIYIYLYIYNNNRMALIFHLIKLAIYKVYINFTCFSNVKRFNILVFT